MVNFKITHEKYEIEVHPDLLYDDIDFIDDDNLLGIIKGDPDVEITATESTQKRYGEICPDHGADFTFKNCIVYDCNGVCFQLENQGFRIIETASKIYYLEFDKSDDGFNDTIKEITKKEKQDYLIDYKKSLEDIILKAKECLLMIEQQEPLTNY